MSDYLDPANEELLKDFFEEAQAQVDLLEQNIIVLENDPDNRDAVDEIFRAAHTLKGGAATVDMRELAEFTHLVEDVLDEIRSGKLKVSREVVDTLLRSIDITKAMVGERRQGRVFSDDFTDLRSELSSLMKAETKEKPGTAKAPRERESALSEYELLELQSESGGELPLYRVRVAFNADSPMNTVGGIQVYALLNKSGKLLKSQPDLDQLNEDVFHPVVDYFIATEETEEKLKKMCSLPEVTTGVEVESLAGKKAKAADLRSVPQAEGGEASAPKAKAIGEPPAPTAKKAAMGSALRVDSRRIDDLLNLVSEAVIIKAAYNQIANLFTSNLSDLLQLSERTRENMRGIIGELPTFSSEDNGSSLVERIQGRLQERFEALFQQIDAFEGKLKGTLTKFKNTARNFTRVTSEMQEGVMKIRMVPISYIFSRFPRLVRDLNRSLNKDADLVIEGEETELDKSVIEDILDPLIHCVRNSLDHGIETPEERQQVGKPPKGRILLRALNEGSQIVIEVSDDGHGIDVETIRRKAVEKGLVHPNKVLTDMEAFNMIFEAGFSTAGKITNISGRGVGLDVVRRQVEKLNGTVRVWSESGKGTTFTIRLPLTLAIIQGLMVKVGRQIYAIPINSVIESVRIKVKNIKWLNHYEVFNLREDVISLLRLNRLFQIQTPENADNPFVIVVGTGEKKIGLMVDSILGEEDVVIKPLRDRFTSSPGISGATILGDGTVALILDVSQLLDLALKSASAELRKPQYTVI